MMATIKMLIGTAATPLLVGTLLAVGALVCRWRGRRRAGAWLCLVAAVLVYLCALRPVSDALLFPLEASYRPLSDAAIQPEIVAVVVLGSGYAPREDRPVTGALDPDGLARIVEGVRIVRQLPDARLIVSGGARPGFVPSATGYALLARELGIAPDRQVVLDSSLDTGDEAQAVTRLLGSAPFILVTSAYHMPRAVRLMVRAGANPVPAPTGQRLRGPALHLLQDLIPSPASLGTVDRALHEYLGLVALRLGQD